MSAIGSSPGWSNLPQGNFVPEIFSKNVLKFFRRAAVVEAVTNTDYYGEIANYGDTVHIIKEPTITVSDYTRGKNLNIEALDDAEDTLLVDQAKYMAFAVDDIENKQAHLNWESLATSSGAYSLKNSYDAAVLTYMSGQVSTSAPDHVIGSNSATATQDLGASSGSLDMGYGAGQLSPLKIMSRMSRMLDDQDIPEENRWFVANPEFWEVMADENSKLMGVDFTGDGASILRNGQVTKGKIRNFECYKTNNAPDESAANVVLCGHMSSTATASQIAKTEVIRSENFFGDIVRGLHLYGRKTLRDEAMVKAFWQ